MPQKCNLPNRLRFEEAQIKFIEAIMNSKMAALLLVGICIVLAIQLITNTINMKLGGVVFAISLVTLGLFSKGFLKKGK